MISLTTRSLTFNTSVLKITAKESRKYLFYQHKNTRAFYVRDYSLTCTTKNFFSKSVINKKDLFLINTLNIFVQRTLSTEENTDFINFEKVSTETLESLSDYFDEVIEEAAQLKDADVSYGDGVLTIKFGNNYGTYVINRQVPNQQIWLSSPKSGPKRYDFIDGRWIYKHDGKSLHELLTEEISNIVKFPVFFNKCSYSVISTKK